MTVVGTHGGKPLLRAAAVNDPSGKQARSAETAMPTATQADRAVRKAIARAETVTPNATQADRAVRKASASVETVTPGLC